MSESAHRLVNATPLVGAAMLVATSLAPNTASAGPSASAASDEPDATDPAPGTHDLHWPAPPPLDRPAEDRADAHSWDEWLDSALDSYYTAPLAPVVVGLRGVPSVGLRVDEEVAASFAFDVAASLRVALHRGYSPWSVWPELSYTLAVSAQPNRHEIGVGLGWGRVFEEVTSLRWTPRFVADVTDDARLGVGLRNSAVASLFDIVSVELCHQWLSFGSEQQHDVRFGVGLDLLVVVTRAAQGEGLEP